MARINMDGIMSKVKTYVKSDAGQKTMSKYIKDCRSNGRDESEGGGTIITDQAMIRAAETLISMLKETAMQKRIPESVKEHFHSLYYNEPFPCGREGNKYKVDIQFNDDLSRMSLLITYGKNKGKRTGEGIKNIVSLFDTGYNAGKRVYGSWDGHFDPFAYEDTIASRTERKGLNFIKETLDAFNRKWGGVYNAVAYVSAEDERFYSSSRSLGDGMIL